MATHDSLIGISIDAWKFVQATSRLGAKLEPGDQARLTNQARFFLRRVDDLLAAEGMRLVSLEGQRFEPGMAATPLNMDEFNVQDELYVDQTLEPVVMGVDGVIRTGTVMLRRGT